MVEMQPKYEPGTRVVVTQQIPQRDDVWVHKLEGEVVRYEQKKTGSWFAHSRHDRLWLDRLVLKKDDGEIVMFNLDGYTRVDPAAQPASSEGADPAE